MFEESFPIQKHPFLGGWADIDGVDIGKKRAKSEVENCDESDGGQKKYGARLLLLLAYIMLSTVLDDNSNNTQM